MRTAAILFTVALLGCDQGARKATPAPVPRDAAAEGTIRGEVTHTLHGPGRAHAPEESFSETTAMACKVTATDGWGVEHAVDTAGGKGAYELRVPVGHYTVSFQACAEAYCSGRDERIKQVDVTANAPVEASFECEVYAK